MPSKPAPIKKAAKPAKKVEAAEPAAAEAAPAEAAPAEAAQQKQPQARLHLLRPPLAPPAEEPKPPTPPPAEAAPPAAEEPAAAPAEAPAERLLQRNQPPLRLLRPLQRKQLLRPLLMPLKKLQLLPPRSRLRLLRPLQTKQQPPLRPPPMRKPPPPPLRPLLMLLRPLQRKPPPPAEAPADAAAAPCRKKKVLPLLTPRHLLRLKLLKRLQKRLDPKHLPLLQVKIYTEKRLEPTSIPLDLFLEDKNDTTVTIMWSQPEVIGDSGLDGYTIEVCKDGTEDWKAVNEDLQKSCRYVIKNQTTGDRLKIRVAVLVKEVADRPKIRLPRYLRQRYVAQVGEKINLTIPFSGKPNPWDDSGVYEMCVKVDDFEDKAQLILQIVELPGPPASVKVADTWGFNVALEWTAPTDKGNTDNHGLPPSRSLTKRPETGSLVYSENKCGISEEATVAKEESSIVKIGIDYKPPEYKERDFTEPPKFTTALNDRATTVGYSTQAAVLRQGGAKAQGYLDEEPDDYWRRPQVQADLRPGLVNYDGGVYTCKAKNTHGEAIVSCKLEVKQIPVPDAEKQ
ncbi:hypothetical protein KUCAC02_030603 [Chaenocephalus aceratus]|uniref:Uncharacterized protein n=1 Tax=Chaenocephalus aceratus TaxID=36190 RepID=A0ACB9XL20_CHAAC|nr:hypothetical protein KUCAC02_030603 [Chaenocephalus aceratus]